MPPVQVTDMTYERAIYSSTIFRFLALRERKASNAVFKARKSSIM